MRRPHPTLALLLLFATLTGWGQSPRALSSADLKEAIDRLGTVGAVLYVAAHPDDENTAFLVTMVHGRNVRTAYLSMTRGEGGQNLIGSEQGDLLGMVRTQELLAARRIDGAEQYFTRAIDFGYSKTTEETLRLWGKDEILSDAVRVIRRFRPDVIVSRFTPELGGHGNHTSSAAIAAEAFEAAGDSTRFPEQLATLRAWKPRRLVWNVFRFQSAEGAVAPPFSVSEDLGAYDPILGRSYTELAGEARTMHKSQGFGAAENRGSSINFFQRIAGDTARVDLFDGIDLTWRRVRGGDQVQPFVDSLRRTFSDRAPSESVPLLLQIRALIAGLPHDPWIPIKLAEVDELILGCGGIWLDALTSREEYVPGDSIIVTLSVVNRFGLPLQIEGWHVRRVGITGEAWSDIPSNTLRTQQKRGIIPTDMSLRQPSWLHRPPTAFRYEIADENRNGDAQDPASFVATVALRISGGLLVRDIPVRYRFVDPVDGETYRPVAVTSPLRISFGDPVSVFSSVKPKNVEILIEAVRDIRAADVHVELPSGWSSAPTVRRLPTLAAGEKTTMTFEIRPSASAVSGGAAAVASVDGVRFAVSVERTMYKHIPPQILHVPAQAHFLRADIRVKARSVGYVMGAGDDVANGLRRMGSRVELLSDDAILSADLSRFDAVVVGVRAYNTRPALRAAQSRLEQYARDGGTVLVQYQTTGRGESENIAPYALAVGRDRVTEENAAMRFLAPRHPALTTPNLITSADFDGWVQERGLYYASSWGKEFTPIVGANDTGEPPRDGGLLVARVGKGHYVYTGLSFFRQIPAGVSGAYRLLANLVSLSRP